MRVVLWGLWVLTLLLYAFAALVLSYHWRSYSSEGDRHIRLARRTFYSIGIGILAATALALLSLGV